VAGSIKYTTSDQHWGDSGGQPYIKTPASGGGQKKKKKENSFGISNEMVG
jgi:hypothetical protein